MTALATLEQVNGAPSNGAPLPSRAQAVSPLELTYQQLWEFSQTVAESGMFPGIDKAAKAMTLMMLSQCDRIHPVLALKRYHIIEGRPSLKAATLHAEFLARGGEVTLIRCDAEEARAFFMHPKLQPKGFEMAVTWEDCKEYAYGEKGLKKNWRQSRSDMLWNRLMAKGIRKIDPGIETGIPTSEELSDIVSWERDPFDALPMPKDVTPAHTGPLPPAAGDITVPGGPEGAFDPRGIHEVIQAACDKVGLDYADALSQLRYRAVQLGLWTKAVPTRRPQIIEMLGSLYRSDRDWLRSEIAGLSAPGHKTQADPLPPPAPAPKQNGCPLKTGIALQEWARATGVEEEVDLLKHLAAFGREGGFPPSLKFWSADQIEKGYHDCRRRLEERMADVPF